MWNKVVALDVLNMSRNDLEEIALSTSLVVPGVCRKTTLAIRIYSTSPSNDVAENTPLETIRKRAVAYIVLMVIIENDDDQLHIYFWRSRGIVTNESPAFDLTNIFVLAVERSVTRNTSSTACSWARGHAHRPTKMNLHLRLYYMI